MKGALIVRCITVVGHMVVIGKQCDERGDFWYEVLQCRFCFGLVVLFTVCKAFDIDLFLE